MPVNYTQTADGAGPTYNADTQQGLEGFSRVRGGRSAIHERRVASAAQLFRDVLMGDRPDYWLKEAIMPRTPELVPAIQANYPGLLHVVERQAFGLKESYTTSDFTNLMGDVLDRMLLGSFREFPQSWRQYIRVRRPLRDFRTVRALALNGAEGQYTEQEEGEGIDYVQTLSEDNYTYAPALYSKGVKLSWRMIMNDDLDAFESIPERLGRGGRRTIAKFATDLLFDANGPDATFFSTGNGNLLTNNPDLAIDSLGTAFETLLGFTDSDSEPILVEGVTLIYPPTLHVTVQNMLNMLTVDLGATEGGASNQTIRVNNWIVRNLTAVMDPYIPIVASSANGGTSWILASSPTSGRPMAEIGFLRGFEEPQLYRKASNAVRVGGGIDDMHGDFETMAQHYKGVLALGGTLLEPQSAVASNGSNG